MEELKTLDKKIKAEEKRKKAAKPPKNGNTVKCMKLTNDVKKLKEQLNSSKANEQQVKKMLQARVQEKADLKKSKLKLENHIKNLERTISENGLTIQDLRRQVSTKETAIKNVKASLNQEILSSNIKKQESEAQLNEVKKRLSVKEIMLRDCEIKCSLTMKKLAAVSLKANAQTQELEKLKLDMDIMDKSIIDSLKTQQSFKEQAAKLEKEVEELRENPLLAVKVDELQKLLSTANIRVDDLQKSLAQERKLTQNLTKEANALQQEQKRKSAETKDKILSLEHNMVSLKTSLSQKMQQCRFLKDETIKLNAEIKRRDKVIDMKEMVIKAKEEEFKTKVCQYCGF